MADTTDRKVKEKTRLGDELFCIFRKLRRGSFTPEQAIDKAHELVQSAMSRRSEEGLTWPLSPSEVLKAGVALATIFAVRADEEFHARFDELWSPSWIVEPR